MSRATKDYNSVDWSSIYEYDPNAGPTCLVWKNKGDKTGLPAGSVSYSGKTNYRACTVSANSSSWRASRVIWILHNGYLPKENVIDHIDGNTLNNNLSNLRMVTQEINNRNARRRKDNSTGKSGVHFTTANDGLYVFATATWYHDSNQRKCKHFSVQKMGLLPAYAAACQHRNAAIDQLNAEGKGYTDRHIDKKGN